MKQPSWMTRSGWIVTGLACAFLLMDATMKLLALAPVLEAGQTLGFPGVGINRALGAILLISTLLALWPRTALPGMILVTGYLGGAVATQLRIDAPLASHVFFGVYIGIVLWMGLFLRSEAFRGVVLTSRNQ